ncbi:TolC family outer membrane protein [Sphingomonas ginsenosidivorax]|uniref:TolC family outer membrane protein n=1 Tax=Sphingomonas ginsenosidivorax TaxID=862135 RepID=A0A5C6UIZ4_9SPHN|nr:TolC family outer membrane protein [Sphingomonas ginsenosidivorax]TXC72782.1 TolC family outer membrane protein [Sphingomonas ginsenosidivorax]
MTQASAETLREALLKAYSTNPTITAQRAQQRATDENVPIARAAGLPSANATGDYTEFVVNAANNFLAPQRQGVAGANVSIPLYRGGQVRNSVAAAQTRVEAGRAQLRGTEADLFTNVVAAYMDVIRDEAIVGLNTQNVRVLDVNLQASRDRFQVGDLTRTDVAQSEARLALARAQLQSAQAQLISSRESYVRLVGTPAGILETPPTLPHLPDSPASAVTVAIDNNPVLLAAAKERDATRYDIGVARASRLPQVSAVGGASYTNYLNSIPPSGGGLGAGTTPNANKAVRAGLSLTMPLFQGGRPAAQVRQAEALRSRAIENVTATERNVIAQARSAYAVWRSSEQVIQSSETAVNANKLSLEGVRAENSVGTRTILDILNAEQELLNSQVTLVTARRDAYVAGFALLAAMGEAEARDLGLDGGVLYDPVANYNRVRRKIWDWGGDGEPVAVATRTVQSPAQDAVVRRPQDELLDSPVDRSPGLTTGAASPNRQ